MGHESELGTVEVRKARIVPLDDTSGNDTLFGIEVGGRLVDQVDVGGFTEGEDDGDSLQLSSRERRDQVVHDVLELHRLHDVRVELGVHVRGAHLLEEQFSNGTGELGRDRLRLERNVEMLLVSLDVGLELSGEQLDKGRLSGSILSEEDDDLRVGKGTTLEVELEVALSLGHGRVDESSRSVLVDLFEGVGDLESEGLFSETQVLGRDPSVEEDVDTCSSTRAPSARKSVIRLFG